MRLFYTVSYLQQVHGHNYLQQTVKTELDIVAIVTWWLLIVIVFVPKYKNILFIHIEAMERCIRYVRHIIMTQITICNILTRHNWWLCNKCSHFLAFLHFYSFYHSILSVCNSSYVMSSF